MTIRDTIIGATGTVAAFVAAAFWFYASVIDVPNNMDTLIDELQRIGRWNAWGAFAASIAALCATYVFLRENRWL